MARLPETGAAVRDPIGWSRFLVDPFPTAGDVNSSPGHRVALGLAIAYHQSTSSEIEEADITELLSGRVGRVLGYPDRYRTPELVEAILSDLVRTGYLTLSDEDPAFYLSATEAGWTEADQSLVDRARPLIRDTVVIEHIPTPRRNNHGQD